MRAAAFVGEAIARRDAPASPNGAAPALKRGTPGRGAPENLGYRGRSPADVRGGDSRRSGSTSAASELTAEEIRGGFPPAPFQGGCRREVLGREVELTAEEIVEDFLVHLPGRRRRGLAAKFDPSSAPRRDLGRLSLAFATRSEEILHASSAVSSIFAARTSAAASRPGRGTGGNSSTISSAVSSTSRRSRPGAAAVSSSDIRRRAAAVARSLRRPRPKSHASKAACSAVREAEASRRAIASPTNAAARHPGILGPAIRASPHPQPRMGGEEEASADARELREPARASAQ